MTIASITEARNSLSALTDRLTAGSPAPAVDRERPVAQVEPVTGSSQERPDGKLSRLLRDGVVRPRRNHPPQALFSTRPPSLRSGRSGVDALIKERQDAR
jgi:antitoxin (DNA-binding transcriptional repressor) of toxin-antitoxin stability system